MRYSIKTKLDEMALERDSYKCRKCGKTESLEVHHIVYEEQLKNLITLCHSCHKKAHNMSGCFVKGKDSRRDTEKGKENLKQGNYKGHPFWGNQYALNK